MGHSAIVVFCIYQGEAMHLGPEGLRAIREKVHYAGDIFVYPLDPDSPKAAHHP